MKTCITYRIREMDDQNVGLQKWKTILWLYESNFGEFIEASRDFDWGLFKYCKLKDDQVIENIDK